jgi:hypothetical protein
VLSKRNPKAIRSRSVLLVHRVVTVTEQNSTEDLVLSVVARSLSVTNRIDHARSI